jgi:UDP-glucose 6-dehydrogenase
MTNSIGIIGQGFVGKILKRYYPDAKVYDIVGEHDPLREVLAQQLVFVAINFKDNCASQENRDKLNDYFAAMKPGTLVVVKSTFIPGTLDYFQDLHKHLNFVYNCEFLTELSAWDDFTNPIYQIFGVPYQSLHLIHDLIEISPKAPHTKIISPKDAETLKHAFNSFYSMKVIFFNQLYDACQKLETDYETIREILVLDPRIGDSHSLVFHKGYRGYGGKCLPKDTDALRKLTEFPLLDKVAEINETLRSV